MKDNVVTFKIILIVTILLETFIIISIWGASPQGYEYSIYIFPSSTYATIIIVLISQVFVLYYYINSYTNREKIFLGIALVFSWVNLEFIFVYLQFIKGYILWDNADSLTHLSRVIKIAQTAHIAQDNFYPLFFIYNNVILTIIRISIWELAKLYLIAEYFLYILVALLMAIALYHEKQYRQKIPGYLMLIGYIFLTIPMLGRAFFIRFIPNMFSMLILIIGLYLNYKYSHLKRNKELCLIAIISIELVFAHPLTAFVWILYLIGEVTVSTTSSTKRKYMSIFGVTTVTFIYWIIVKQSKFFGSHAKTVINILTKRPGEVIEHTSNYASALSLTKMEEAYIIFREYGTLITEAMVFSYIALRAIRTREEISNLKKYLIQIVILSMFGVVVFIGSGDIEIFFRLPNYFLVFLTIAITDLIILQTKHKTVQKLLSVLIIGIIMGLSLFSIYPTPDVYKPNTQITTAQLQGYKWFYFKLSPKHSAVILPASVPYRFFDVFNAIFNKYPKIDSYSFWRLNVAPYHFGYTSREKEKWINSIHPNYYFVLSKVDIIAYTKVWSRANRFNDNDFQIFSILNNKIYNNVDISVYIITPINLSGY